MMDYEHIEALSVDWPDFCCQSKAQLADVVLIDSQQNSVLKLILQRHVLCVVDANESF